MSHFKISGEQRDNQRFSQRIEPERAVTQVTRFKSVVLGIPLQPRVRGYNCYVHVQAFWHSVETMKQ
ncbi:hypothetical protein E2C01_100425 [Portunus trituberculatus]|uniref:Uncharacterized protein n=1 Tax=Portunus trituberculatus TaxID=210409 RepID=A0A5B7KC69_PORTR|nr:hypothetical protein [Portunus trituberculatus]